MSSQLQYLLIGACILGFAAMEFITRRYQVTVRDSATANDTWLEVLMFVSLIAITQPIALLGSNALCNWLMPAQHNAWANLPWWAMAGLLLAWSPCAFSLNPVLDISQYAHTAWKIRV